MDKLILLTSIDSNSDSLRHPSLLIFLFPLSFSFSLSHFQRQTKQLSVQEAEAVLGGSSDPLAYDGDEEKSKLLDPSASSIGARKKIDYLSLMGRIWKDAFVVLMIFFVTLALFPGMTLEIETTTSLGQDWFGILLIVSFSLLTYVTNLYLFIYYPFVVLPC
jgi:hypothetical protein